MKRSDSRLTVTAGKPAYRGFSIAHAEGRVIFVRGLLPGERAEVCIMEEKKDYCIAVPETQLSSSEDRILPRCGLFGVCGGCHYQYATYTRQLALKEAILADSFSRIARSEVVISPTLSSPLPWGYRHRAQFKVSPQGIGFFREGSHDIVPVDACPLMTDEINSILRAVLDVFRAMPSLFRDISEIQISRGDATLIRLREKDGSADPGAVEPLCIELLSLGVKGITLLGATGKTRHYGTDRTAFVLGDLSYSVSSGTFFQANWALNQILVTHIARDLAPLEGLSILDLYAGAGNLSLLLASGACEVIAVEGERRAAEMCRENARVNSIGNLRCVNTTAEAFALDSAVDVVILDPPRPGLTGKVLRSLLAWRPDRIVYVSCNPATMARDVGALMEIYEMASLRVVDFFPQTYHIEAVAFLRRRQGIGTPVTGRGNLPSRSMPRSRRGQRRHRRSRSDS